MRGAARDRQLMTIAVIVSLAVHAALMAIRFVPPSSARVLPFDSRLPVILLNARSDAPPLQAEALAQASLDGGGQADAGRVRSPLPDLGRMADGTLLDAQRQRVDALEQRQQRLLQSLQHSPAGTPGGEAVTTEGAAPQALEPSRALARRQAELAQEIADYQKRPVKRQLTPATREVPYALYYTALRKKIEQTGTLHFPHSGGARLYGDLIVSIPLQQDGRIDEGDGGPRIERSSGNPALDAAALAIVRRAAPFGRLPVALADDGRAQQWEVVARFSFTRQQQLETHTLSESRE